VRFLDLLTHHLPLQLGQLRLAEAPEELSTPGGGRQYCLPELGFAAQKWHTGSTPNQSHILLQGVDSHAWLGVIVLPFMAKLLRPVLFQIQAELIVYANCAPLPA
jgi:hypothetical protein